MNFHDQVQFAGPYLGSLSVALPLKTTVTRTSDTLGPRIVALGAVMSCTSTITYPCAVLFEGSRTVTVMLYTPGVVKIQVMLGPLLVRLAAGARQVQLSVP